MMKKLRVFLLLSALVLFSAILTGCGKREPMLYNPSRIGLESTSESSTEAEKTTEAPTTTAPETTEEITTEEATEEPTTAEQASPLEVGAKWYVNTDSLNIRSGPSTATDVVATLYRGEQILILSIQGEWLEIMSSAGNGFVNVNYVVSTYAETGLTGAPPTDADDEASENTAPSADNTAGGSAANGHIVCIDAGHQQAGISEQEPNGPGSSVMKAKLTTGTQGCVTGLPEHQLNLTISLALKETLINRGYQVVMIRETADCPMSNAERAQLANSSGAEIFVRIHANSSDNSDVSGAQFYAPSSANPYLSADVINASNTLSSVMLDSFCAATGAVNRGVLQDDNMTGINWCTIPVTIAEMGFMSNPTEDQLMSDPSYQAKMVQGLADGIDAYFSR